MAHQEQHDGGTDSRLGTAFSTFTMLGDTMILVLPSGRPPGRYYRSINSFMRRTKVAAIDVGCLLSAVSPVTTFSRLSRRVGGGAHRASEGSWSSWTSSTSWTS